MTVTVGQDPLAEVNLRIRQGSDCSFALTYAATDDAGAVVVQSFTGWTCRAQLRARVGGAVWHELAGAELVLSDDGAGTLTVAGHISHTVTEAVAWNSYGSGVWDMELTRADGWVIPLVSGSVSVTHDVTRDVVVP